VFELVRELAREEIQESRTSQIKNQLSASVGDSRKMWRTVKHVQHSTPNCGTNDEECTVLSQSYCRFSIDRLDRIRESIKAVVSSASGLTSNLPLDNLFKGESMTAFNNVTLAKATAVIVKMSKKSSPLDIPPTTLLNSCADLFAPKNKSLTEDEFPSPYNTAQILPMLKKPGLDQSVSAINRLIPSLNTVSKIHERLALARLKPHLHKTGSFNPLQSASATRWRLHCCEF
jgi:hypothetical protein